MSQWRYMCSISLPSIRDSSLIISQIIEQDRGTDSPRALSEMAVCQDTILPFVNAFTRMNKCIQRHQACWCDYLALLKPALSSSQQNTHTKTETIALICCYVSTAVTWACADLQLKENFGLNLSIVQLFKFENLIQHRPSEQITNVN